MTEQEDDVFWDQLVKLIEDRIKDQISWHIQRGSTGDTNQLFDIALHMEEEKLEQRASAYEDKGQDELARPFRALKDALPELLNDLRHRL